MAYMVSDFQNRGGQMNSIHDDCWDWRGVEAQAKANFEAANPSSYSPVQVMMAISSLWFDAMNMDGNDSANEFAVCMQELLHWTYHLNGHVNKTRDPLVLGFKVGSPPRKFIDLFNDIASIFNSNIRVDKAFSADDLRPFMERVGIPYKPYHLLAIDEEVQELLQKTPIRTITKSDLAVAIGKKPNAINSHMEKGLAPMNPGKKPLVFDYEHAKQFYKTLGINLQ